MFVNIDEYKDLIPFGITDSQARNLYRELCDKLKNEKFKLVESKNGVNYIHDDSWSIMEKKEF